MGIRYGIIGAGMMGQEHIRNIRLLDGAEVAAVADPDAGMRAAARLAAGTGAQAFEDWRAMVTADLCDAYVIASPNDTHHPLLLGLLPANKPVLVEKPLCTTAADCRAVIAVAAGRTAPVWVAMEYRYMPAVARLLDEVAQGTAGTPRMIAIREHRFPFLPKVGHWNRFAARSGGTLIEKCCHFWDLMRLAMGSDPVRVYASGGMDENFLNERYDGRVPDILDNAFVTVDFASGARGMLDLCMFAEGSEWQEVISVTGPRARLDAMVPGPARFAAAGARHASRFVVSDRASRTARHEEIEVDPAIMAAGDHHGSTFFQHQRFHDLVRRGHGTPEVTLEDGLWAVMVGEAADASARLHQPVEL